MKVGGWFLFFSPFVFLSLLSSHFCDNINTMKTKYYCVIGSRSLDKKYNKSVSLAVQNILAAGYGIGSGGALGADNTALAAVVAAGSGACKNSIVVLPVQAPPPLAVRPVLAAFQALGGFVAVGPGGPFPGCLFARSRQLVAGSAGVVAFVSGQANGSWFTCSLAARLGLSVRVCLCGQGAKLPGWAGGGWVKSGLFWVWRPSQLTLF